MNSSEPKLQTQALKPLIEAYQAHGELMRENLRTRLDIRYKMKCSPAYRAMQRRKAFEDIFYWFENFVWTHEPRPHYVRWYGFNTPTLPFLLFDYQKPYIEKLCKYIEEGQDLLTDKSRDMGASWLVVTVFLWYWMKDEGGNDFLIGSRKREYVDKKGAVDTLFQKIRYNLYYQPASFLPKGYHARKDDNVGMILNHASGNYIRGEANNANFGTSGRYRSVLIDEFSKWEETDSEAWTSLADATSCRFPVSTPKGIGNKFAQLRFSGAIDVESLHWSLHPLKSAGSYETEDEKGRKKIRSPWYDMECERRKDDPEANVAQELDIDYLRSGKPYFDNTIVQNHLTELEGNPPVCKRYIFEVYGKREKQTVKLIERDDGPLFILKPAISKKWRNRYCIAADVAEGLEHGDNSAFYVFDRVAGLDVAWYAGRIDTDALALLLHHVSELYQDAWIAPESNNHGHAVISKLKGFTDRIIYEQDFREDYDLDQKRLGHRTDGVSRPIQLSMLREAVRENYHGIADVEFFREAMTFIYNKRGKAEAESGRLDDRVLAQSIKWIAHSWLPEPKDLSRAKRKRKGKSIYSIPGQKSDIRNFWD